MATNDTHPAAADSGPLQMSLLAENSALHPIRREQTELRTFALTGYLEGWAEYAASLCEEIGMYTEPRDRYGRMTSERFFAARMAADTGLNVLGWSLDKAAACLRDSSLMSEPEIASEVLRYAVDDPGQALAYHVGHRATISREPPDPPCPVPSRSVARRLAGRWPASPPHE
jgi:uncharacterized protein (DUF885 family)